MSWSAPDWIYSRGETNPPSDNRFESSEGHTNSAAFRNANLSRGKTRGRHVGVAT
jgi:hypothetical protein